MRFERVAGGALPLCFGVVAFALAGIPPFSGFFGKLGIFRVALEEGAYAGLVLLVLASVFTLASMLKIWRFAFQRAPLPEGSVIRPQSIGRAPIILAAVVLTMTITAGPLVRFTKSAAEQLLDVDAYAEAVLALPGYPAPSSILEASETQASLQKSGTTEGAR